MPQLIFLILLVAAAIYGYRSFKREAARVSKKVRQAEQEARTGASGTLVRDPKTGVYRPADKD
ncbi:hypothetical protein [Pseudochrobactrum kiredjianiae]|uniref:Uncharacterized protein n=1 Tax=Pseudochrobactrum kiredjianiae TaxID=386305 RepID=A0ABW3V710_9HYPH|nr:hypothetical protein [Pseudochrobactrum kiredjianiae]MDM7850223.1 hypothetical protein [Pseudochrobactrum kiredjianiae]